MKSSKKLASIGLAVAMVASMGVNAFANDDVEIQSNTDYFVTTENEIIEYQQNDIQSYGLGGALASAVLGTTSGCWEVIGDDRVTKAEKYFKVSNVDRYFLTEC